MIGTLIGGYRVERQVTAGELSSVYAARDERTGRQVAIKVARLPEDEAARASFVMLFDREISLLEKLDAEAVTSIYGHGVLDDGSPYFVMEWLEGQDLETVLALWRRVPLRTAIGVARQIAGGLAAAHAIGFVHRDLKPANVLVLGDTLADSWTVKLLDFGVAEKLQEDTGKTRSGNFVGSVRYMSPEQIRAEPLSASSDIWQLGVTLLEMLTGDLPFNTGQTVSTMLVVMNAEVTIPAELNLPPAVTAFLRRCLSKDPAARPADGGEALRELLQLEQTIVGEEAPTWAMSSEPRTTRVPAPVRNDPLSVTQASIPAWPTRSKPVLARPAFGTIILVAVAVLGVVVAVVVIAPYMLPTHTGEWGAALPFKGPSMWGRVWLGAALVVAGVVCGAALQRALAARRGTITSQAHDLLTGARSRDHLSETLAFQVDSIAARCRLVDEKFLAMTMAVMVDEYGASATFDDRQKALMNAVTLLEKLMAKLSPWYVRHDKLVALLVTLVGVLSGLATVAQSVAKIVKGTG